MITKHQDISIRKQCELLEVSRSTLYHIPKGECDENISLMEKIDRLHLEYPTYGVLRMQDQLSELGVEVNHKRVRRLMRKMQIHVIYPKVNLSKLGKAKYIHPYLLKDLTIVKPNQVWAIDITYVPMKKGFMYLTGIIDLYSRKILGWDISNSLEAETQTDLVEKTILKYGKPDIINSDQGSQYTSSNWEQTLKKYGIKISMDGKGRATDNAFIERFFRTLKQDHIYLNPANDGWELAKGVACFIKHYNNCKHQGINRQKPNELYKHKNAA